MSEGLVSFTDVHVSFGAMSVLNGISLSVQPGQAVSIIGPSGAGKSTLLRCITGLVPVQSGRLSVLGQCASTLRTEAAWRALRQKIGFVFQQFNLFPHLTVLENIVIAPIRVLGQLRQQAEQQAKRLLARVGLGDKVSAYPSQLSGGQQQRVAIARALMMEPELILFDEVTSALDPEKVGEVLMVIRQLVDEGMACVLVTHEMAFAAEVSDVVFFTEAGRVVEQGSSQQIFEQPTQARTRAFVQGLARTF